MSERVAIVGSRNWEDSEAVRVAVCGLPPGTVVVSGGCRGVDRTAEKEALAMGFVVVSVQPPWSALGPKAGPARNSVIVDIADRGIAFWDGQSPGTKDTIEKFRRAGKPIEVIQRQGGKRGK